MQQRPRKGVLLFLGVWYTKESMQETLHEWYIRTKQEDKEKAEHQWQFLKAYEKHNKLHKRNPYHCSMVDGLDVHGHHE